MTIPRPAWYVLVLYTDGTVEAYRHASRSEAFSGVEDAKLLVREGAQGRAKARRVAATKALSEAGALDVARRAWCPTPLCSTCGDRPAVEPGGECESCANHPTFATECPECSGTGCEDCIEDGDERDLTVACEDE